MLSRAAEDTSGFGVADLRVTRDLILKPRSVMGAYETNSTGGGQYPRPLRYLLSLNGVYLALMAFMGGFQRSMPPESRIMFTELAQSAGKTLDGFMADFEHMLALLLVPMWLLITAFPLALCFKAWAKVRYRAALRQVLIFLSLWTLLSFVPGLPGYIFFPHRPEVAAASLAIAPIAFWMLGGGRWFSTPGGAVAKGLTVAVLMAVLYVPSSLASFIPALVGAYFMP